MKQVFLLSPLFKDGEGGNYGLGGRHLFRGGGFFRDTQSSLFQKFYYMSFISFYKQVP